MPTKKGALNESVGTGKVWNGEGQRLCGTGGLVVTVSNSYVYGRACHGSLLENNQVRSVNSSRNLPGSRK